MLKLTWSKASYVAAALGLLSVASPVQYGRAAEGTPPSLPGGIPLLPAGDGPQPLPRPDWLLGGSLPRTQVYRSRDGSEVILANGLIQRRLRLTPNGATVGLDDLRSGQHFLRAVKPEARITLDGKAYTVGGLLGQRDLAYLAADWIPSLTNDPSSFQLESVELSDPVAPFGWKRTRRAADLAWPPAGRHVALAFRGPDTATRGLHLVVHHEMYDGVPVSAKWITLSNGTPHAVVIDALTNEELAVVEAESAVDGRERHQWVTPPIDVLSDYMFKGMDPVTAGRVSSWEPDRAYGTQVSYELQTPCLLVCRPMTGPGVRIEPGHVFTGLRTYLIPHDSAERERRGLALRRVWRTLAPWTTENPVMMHVRSAKRDVFRAAVDQCAEVGFEMIIYTFGSGLNMENQDPAYMAEVKADVDYAHAKGIQVGAYSLFSSRRVDDENDVINPATGKPGGAIFGNAPCLGSRWGLEYLTKITNFLAQTGLDLLEHDGPYPGDVCASTRHPGHRGVADSQWEQWRLSVGLYSWCRSHGIYVNQPDCYFMAGGNKTGMGYRESNWSLPRAQQLVHARQHIFDGTWTKTASMGWMFVPLTEYQGGGPAATIEPLRDHLHDYEMHLVNTLGAGVQACWRGPRLYDAPETRDVVKRWVGWYKQHRAILESDMIHFRRADGQGVDAYLHVNPTLKEKALAVLFNPLNEPVNTRIRVPLYYSGLAQSARVVRADGRTERLRLDGQGNTDLDVRLPAAGFTWCVFE
jgi:hypothetical protein